MSSGMIDLECRKCRLCGKRTRVVPGTGSCRSHIVFVGEAPGKDEDVRGEPFVGRAGKVLDDALAGAGIERSQVYISNLVKCRPPGNRRPRRDEIEACSEFILSELKAVGPKIVCALGRTAAESLLDKKVTMSEIAGREAFAAKSGLGLRVYVAYHPAACLYQKKKLPEFRSQVMKALELAGRSTKRK